MDNTTLITKFRPLNFNTVVGHTNEIKSIQDTLKKKLSRSFILSGPPGLGKTTLARIIANEVGCVNPLEMDAASHSGVDDMRSITSELHYKPLRGKSKVVIIDECQKISSSGWDALLKSIEEPPEFVYFILCTTNLDKVPAAIKTRCQSINLKPISENDIFNFLADVCEQESFDVTEEVLDLIAAECQGSPRQALSYLAVCHNAETKADASALLSKSVDTPAVVDLCRIIAKQELTWQKAQMFVKQLTGDYESTRIQILNYLAVVIQNTPDPGKACYLVSCLQAFNQPYNTSDKSAPLILSLSEIVFKPEE